MYHIVQHWRTRISEEETMIRLSLGVRECPSSTYCPGHHLKVFCSGAIVYWGCTSRSLFPPPSNVASSSRAASLRLCLPAQLPKACEQTASARPRCFLLLSFASACFSTSIARHLRSQTVKVDFYVPECFFFNMLKWTTRALLQI